MHGYQNFTISLKCTCLLQSVVRKAFFQLCFHLYFAFQTVDDVMLHFNKIFQTFTMLETSYFPHGNSD